MTFGNTPIDGGLLLLSRDERDALQLTPEQQRRFVRRVACPGVQHRLFVVAGQFPSP